MMKNERYAIVLIIGFTERSGRAAWELLRDCAAEFYVYDDAPYEEKADLLTDAGIDRAHYVGPERYDFLLRAVELAVLSPGVPRSLPVVRDCLLAGVELVGEIELAYRFYRGGALLAVTGTDGKSTVVALTALMLQKSGVPARACGNIGLPFAAFVRESEPGTAAVVEVSSFQLESITTFRPNAALITNVAEDHLDRYAGMADYVAAKQRVYMNMGRPLNRQVMLNAECPELTVRPGDSPLWFARDRAQGADAYIEGKTLVEAGRVLADISGFRLPGRHNEMNALSAALLASRAGATRAGMEAALAEFDGLDHRCRPVGEYNKRLFIDNSKGTTVSSVRSSLAGFDRPIVLIAGGRDKGLDFSRIRAAVRDRVRYLVLIGEAAQRIHEVLADVPTGFAETMAEAVRSAYDHSRAGDVILLSPMCTSWDMYRDYAERGRDFADCVDALRREVTS